MTDSEAVPSSRYPAPPRVIHAPCGITIECADVVQHMPVNIGDAVRHLWRVNGEHASSLANLRWAIAYAEAEIARLTAGQEPQAALPLLGDAGREAFREEEAVAPGQKLTAEQEHFLAVTNATVSGVPWRSTGSAGTVSISYDGNGGGSSAGEVPYVVISSAPAPSQYATGSSLRFWANGPGRVSFSVHLGLRSAFVDMEAALTTGVIAGHVAVHLGLPAGLPYALAYTEENQLLRAVSRDTTAGELTREEGRASRRYVVLTHA